LFHRDQGKFCHPNLWPVLGQELGGGGIFVDSTIKTKKALETNTKTIYEYIQEIMLNSLHFQVKINLQK
jgi:hypothetical protein